MGRCGLGEFVVRIPRSGGRVSLPCGSLFSGLPDRVVAEAVQLVGDHLGQVLPMCRRPLNRVFEFLLQDHCAVLEHFEQLRHFLIIALPEP